MAALISLWSALKKVFHTIGRVMTVVVLTLVYIVVFLPLGALLRAFGRAPLQTGQVASSTWHDRPVEHPTLDDAQRPF